MPGKSNIKGGKKHKRAKKTTTTDNTHFPTAEEGQLYAEVIKKLGGLWLSVLCSDDVVRQAFIRGALRKTIWIHPADILLVSCRDFAANDNKCDIIYKYTTGQAKQLSASGAIKFEIKETENDSIWENSGAVKDDGEFEEVSNVPKTIGQQPAFNFDDI